MAALDDEAVRAKVFEIFGDMEQLRATLRDLQVRRSGMSHPGMFAVDTHEMFINSSAFQETLLTLQKLSEQQKALLADRARVSGLCPTQWDPMLRLNVELMTAFSRLATQPGTVPTEDMAEDIADHSAEARTRSLSASI